MLIINIVFISLAITFIIILLINGEENYTQLDNIGVNAPPGTMYDQEPHYGDDDDSLSIKYDDDGDYRKYKQKREPQQDSSDE
jgi:hypothetical protein